MKIPPHNIQAELEILSACMIGQALDLVSELTPEDFYSTKHKEIFTAITAILARKEDVTIASLLEELRGKISSLEIVEIMNNVSYNPKANIKILHDNTYLRKLIRESKMIETRAYEKDFEDIEQFKTEVEEKVSGLRREISNVNICLDNIPKRAESFYEESLTKDGLLGYRLGPEWYETQGKIDGVQTGMYLVSATANAGKTTWMLNMGLSLVEYNPTVHVVYFSIDDIFKKVYYRLLAHQSRKPINYVANLGSRITYNSSLSEEEKSKYMKEMQQYKNKVDKILERFHLLDTSDGNDIEFIKNTVKQLKHRYTNLVVFLDNFHKCRIKNFKSSDAKDRFTFLSEECKEIVNKYDVPFFMTVELRKLNHQGPPVMDDLKDTVDLQYDADCVFFLHNDWNAKQDQSTEFIRAKTEVNGKICEFIAPYIEVNIAKNKLSGFKGVTKFVLYPDIARVAELSHEQELMKAEKVFGGKK